MMQEELKKYFIPKYEDERKPRIVQDVNIIRNVPTGYLVSMKIGKVYPFYQKVDPWCYPGKPICASDLVENTDPTDWWVAVIGEETMYYSTLAAKFILTRLSDGKELRFLQKVTFLAGSIQKALHLESLNDPLCVECYNTGRDINNKKCPECEGYYTDLDYEMPDSWSGRGIATPPEK